MKYFFDTEFIERPCTIDLISIGVVCEDGRELYCISNEFDESKASQWVKDNVITKLGNHPRVTRGTIKNLLLAFVGEDKPEFWAYYADYDWVALCWLMGTMMELPDGWPMYCRDLKQWADTIECGDIPEFNTGDEHNALADAKQNMKAYEWLRIFEIARKEQE